MDTIISGIKYLILIGLSIPKTGIRLIVKVVYIKAFSMTNPVL